jgi:F-type H+-transporting ATPase subunit b
MLEINPQAVITQALAFLLLALFMGKVIFPKVTATLDERAKEIQDSLDQVAADRAAMQATRADYEQRLAGIEAEAREKISSAVKQAQEEGAALLAAARLEAGAQRDRALAEIDQERKKAVAEIRSQMADLAVLAAGKVLEREITPGVHRELISDFIGEVGGASN